MLSHDTTVAPLGDKRALTIREFTQRYGISRDSVYRMEKRGQIRLSRIGGRTLIAVDEAERLLRGEAV